MKYIVFDTNILLQDASTLLSYMPKDTIVLPETVLDELDSKKSGFSELAFQAREVGRIIAKGKLTATDKKDGHTYNHFDIGRPLLVISKDTYKAVGEERAILNDRKIIEIAKDIGALFISNDVMARIRASSLGVAVAPMNLVEDVDEQTLKTLQVTSIAEALLYPVDTVDPDFKESCKAYLLKAEDGNQKLCLVHNNKFTQIDESDLARQEATPLNSEQRLLSSAILSDDFDIVLSDSKAGSGKNIIALSSMMKLIKTKKYSRIYYVRNTVHNFDKAEEVGFLKGNEEKFEPFFAPLYDTLRAFAEMTMGNFKGTAEAYEIKVEEKIEAYMKRFNITPITTLGLRGRTLNGLILIDEVGNFSPGSLKTLMTRVGKDSKVVAIGCQSQIDNPYLNMHNNGFAVLKKAKSTDNTNIISISLLKVVRGPITEFAEEIF